MKKLYNFVENLGEIAQKSSSGKFENSFEFSDFLAISPKFSPNLKSFIMQSYGGCLFNRQQLKTVQFWGENYSVTML